MTTGFIRGGRGSVGWRAWEYLRLGPVAPTDPDRTVTLLTAPSLAQVLDGMHAPPGYFIVHFKEGALAVRRA